MSLKGQKPVFSRSGPGLNCHAGLTHFFMTEHILKPSRILRITALFALSNTLTFGSLLFVPGGFANTPADSNGISPLSVGSFFLNHGGTPGGRMDQLYNAAEFASFGPIMITQLAFRNWNGDSPNPNSPTLGNIEVYLDTTPQTIAGISSTFANNFNAPVLVYSGAVTFNLPFDNGNPRCFCYTISFATPYVYDPSAGNLLMDIRILVGNNPFGSSLPTLDFQRDTPTSAMSFVVDYSSGTAVTGGAGVQQGFPTQFTIQAVPEPSAAALALLGVLLIGLRVRRRSNAVARRSKISARVNCHSESEGIGERLSLTGQNRATPRERR